MLFLEDPFGQAEEFSEVSLVEGEQQAEIQGRTFPGLKAWTAENC